MIDYKNMSITNYNKIAELYEDSWDYKYVSLSRKALLENIFSMRFSSLLDVGCGNANLLCENKIIESKAALYGIDVSPKMIEVSRIRTNGRANLFVTDGLHIPLENDAVDLAVCSFTFHHFPKPEATALDIARVLRSGGRLIICDPWLPIGLRNVMNLLLPYSKKGDVRIYAAREIKEICGRAGFRFSHMKHTNAASSLYVFEKP